MLCDHCKQPIKQRTLTQNRALHLWFTQVADTLNESGMDMRAVIREEVDIPWNMENVKNHLWRPLQIAILNKESTAKLTTSEIDKVYEVLNKVIGERCGFHIPFPCIDDLINKFQ